VNFLEGNVQHIVPLSMTFSYYTNKSP